jgi:hypothetical protein
MAGTQSRILSSMSEAERPQRVRHVVLFKLKDGTSPATIHEIEAAFASLRQQIPQIRDLEWGTDMSPEGRQAGHTHAFLVTFDTPGERDAYLPHPARRAFLLEVLKPHLEKATVLDYVARVG